MDQSKYSSQTRSKSLPAVVLTDESITYEELFLSSNRLSHLLQSLGFAPGDVVGTLLPSGIDLVCSVFGIMKVGGVYMPMDEAYSDRRLVQMLEESGAKVLILTATDRLFVEALLARCEHQVEYLVVFPSIVSELMEGLNVAGIDLIAASSTGLEVFRIVAGDYVQVDVSLSDQPTTDPGVQVGADSPCYIYYTSGSSGRSKGIKGSYGSLSHYVQWHAREWGLGAGSRVAQFCSPGFDAWLKDVLPTLISGGTVCIVPKDVRSNLGRLSAWLNDSGVTHLQTVPSIFRLLTASLQASGERLSTLNQVILAGEPLYGQDVLNWRSVQGEETRLANMYGLTETTILKTFYRIPLGDWSPGEVIPVGEAISDTRIAVIHEGGLCLHGELGEVYIKSPYVTLGYLDPALNAGLFVQNPLSQEKDIICRTGDIGRLTSSGALEILGREDDQVKIHGVRIELSEVRSALYELGGIERVELIVHQGEDNNRELLCYYTGVSRPAGDLREALGALLPSMYLPGHYLWLESFPLTLNGKVDRKKLPRPDALVGADSFEAPAGKVEIGLARLWSQVLGKAEIGRQDSFFNLGGSSLKVIQLISWIYKEYEVQLSIGDVFSHPKLSAQAALIQGARHTAYEAIEKVVEQDSYPLAPSQLRLWVQEQRENDALPFNGLIFYRFTGALDYAALERSFQTLLERHESLRTVFIQKKGAPRQRIIPVDALGFKIEHHDLRGVADAEAHAVAMGHQVRLKRFSLSEGPLLRVGLYRLSEDIHLLRLSSHHLITDEWSMQVQSRELITLYNAYTRGQENPLVPLPIQYKDYASWQLSQLSGAELERCSRYWLDQFSDEVPMLSLPSDRPRPAVPTFRGAEYRFTFSADQSAGLKALLSAQEATLFMGLNALLVTLLYRYTGTRDIVIGAPVAGRDHPDLENQIGPYLNTLAFRYRFDAGENFSGLLTQVRQIVLGGFDHQVYPFDYLMDELGLDTLFDVALVLQNIEVDRSARDLAAEGLLVEVLPEDLSIAKGDIRFQFEEGEDGLRGSIEYTTDLYDGNRIQRMVSDLTHLLESILSDPATPLSDLEYLSLEEQKAGEGFSDALPFEQQASLPSRLQKSFAIHKSLPAVVLADESITYEELFLSSNRLSHLLQSLGFAPGDVVGTLLPSGIDLVCSVFGIIKMGGVYMPMDEAYSDRRLEQMLEESGAKVLILTATDRLFVEALLARGAHRVEHLIVFPGVVSELMEGLHVEGVELIGSSSTAVEVFCVEEGEYVQTAFSLSDQPATDPGVEVGADSPCYIYYTSGSSGRSKGIKGSYGSLSHYVQWHAREWGLGVGSRVSQFCSPGFDAWLKDIFPTLISGGTVCIVPKGVRSNLGLLSAWLTDSKVTHLQTVPSIFRLLTASLQASGERLSTLNQVILAGEPLYGQDVLNWRSVQGEETRLANMYGLTETTILKTFYRIPLGDWSPGEVIPVGEAISDTRIAVINEGGLCLHGELGEVYIKSPYVTLGYMDPALNAGLFVQNPLSQEKDIICRTGDIGRLTSSGALEILGREDDQVKIHGVRIELSEVRNALYELGGIERVELIVHQGDDNNRELLCYYTGEAQEAGHLRRALGELLPSMYLPGHYLWLESFPLSFNGKVDRKKLPRPDAVLGSESFEAPVGEVEIGLARLWSKVLSRAEIGRRDSFFNVGGSSLRVIQLISWIYKEYEVQISIGDVFSHPELSAQAELIRGARHTAYKAIEKVAEQDSYALSPSQLRLWIMNQLSPNQIVYNMPKAVRLEGHLDQDRLSHTFKKLIERHEILRTSFGLNGERVVQYISKEVDFKIAQYSADEDQVSAIIHEFIRPFDLSSSPLLRVGLIAISSTNHILMVDVHHIIGDGTSLAITIKEFMALYNHDILPVIDLQYKDYAEWQNREIQQEKVRQQRAFWMEQFAEEISLLQLPADFSRPAIKNFSGNNISFELGQKESKQLKVIGEKEGATLFMTTLALFNILLSKLGNTEDLVIGTPTVGRRHADLENMLGVFVNTLCVRSHPKGELTFKEYLQDIKSNVLACFENEMYPYEELINDLQVERVANHNPLFDVMFSYQHFESLELRIPGLTLSSYGDVQRTSKFDLSLVVLEGNDNLYFRFEYSTELFTRATIERFVDYLQKIVTSVVADPKVTLRDIDILSKEEKDRLVLSFNDTKKDYPEETTVIALFEKQSVQTPHAIALVHHGRQLRYQELNESANQVAHYLCSQGVGAGSVVGIMIDRSIEMVVGILGIIKTGAAYLPLDGDQPEARNLQMLQESEASLLLTEATYFHQYTVHLTVLDIRAAAIQQSGKENLDIPVLPTSLAYILYTSGSTGRPKGVLIGHRGVVNMVYSQQELYGIDAQDNILLFSTITFDASVQQMWLALLSGATLVTVDRDVLLNSKSFSQYLIDQNITHLHVTPSFLEVIDVQQCSHLKRVVLGGEAFTLLARHQVEWIEFFNSYGPTENTVTSVAGKVSAEAIRTGNVPIGRPLRNIQAYVLGTSRELLPAGTIGELYLSGAGLAKGYLKDATLTDEKFVPNPFGAGKMYKTGDFVKWLPDGQLAFIGRIDDQVKIRGYRIELREIAHVLQHYEGVSKAVVLAREHSSEKYLVAYYVSEDAIRHADVKRYLSDVLPEYMVPSYYVRVDQMPLNASGKLDRRSLPDPVLLPDDDYVGARNAEEEQLVDLWSEVLKLEKNQISVTKSFFELGGHSLRAAFLINKIRKQMSVEVPLRELFKHQSVAKLSLFMKSLSVVADVAIEKATSKDHYVLSSAQRRMYFLHIFDKQSLAYNMPQAARLEGDLDLDRLHDTFRRLISRHEMLRTSFGLQGQEVVQYISPEVECTIEQYRADEDQVRAILTAFIRPFDLSSNSLLRVGLITLTPTNHILMVDMHHIISDGISMGIMVKEFMALYNHEAMPALDVQYKDYSEWQHREIHQDKINRQREFWMEEFAEEFSPLQLPFDFTRPAAKIFAGDRVRFELGREAYKQLKAISEKEGATLFMTMLAMFSTLLGKLGNTEDLVIGTPTAGRSHAGLENIIGMFVNTLCIRSYPKGEITFREYLLDVKSSVLACFENELYPYEELITDLQVERDTSHNPLFDVTFSYLNFESVALSIPGLTLSPYDNLQQTSKFDLSLMATEEAENLYLTFEYSTELFTRATIERFVGYLKKMVSSIISAPDVRLSAIDMLSGQEQEHLLVTLNATEKEYPRETTVIALFEQQAARTPDAIALVHHEKQVCYRELNERANQLAHHLRSHGVGAGNVVGIMVGRSIEMVVGLLGILKTGGAYLPLDGDQPEARNLHLLQESEAALLVTEADHLSRFQGHLPVVAISDEALSASRKENPDVDVLPTSLAYVLYTSGSTGKPKGVLIGHRAIVNLVYAQQELYGIDEQDTVLLFSTITFDASVEQMWLALVFGATLVTVDKEVLLDPQRFNRYIIDQHITHLHVTPSFLDVIDLHGCADLKRVVLGGEAFRLNAAHQVARGFDFYNTYGPTENTVTCVACKVSAEAIRAGKSPIGKLLHNIQAYVLGRLGELLPEGTIGELYLAGDGLAAGYLKDARQTDEKFVSNPFREGKMYKTGDFVRWLPDGQLEFIGRIDDQVKIRGYRIELEEISHVLQRYAGVRKAVVLVKEHSSDKYLVAYHVADEAIDAAVLKRYLSGVLPEYMVPGYYVRVDTMPLNASGKLDRRSLPDPVLLPDNDFVGARNAVEEQLVGLWSEVLTLEREKISVTKSFFELGGHSLKAAFLINKIRKQMRVEVPLRQLFAHQSVAKLSLYVEGLSVVEDIAIEKAAPKDYYALSSAQSRMYFLHAFNKESLAYNMPQAVRLEGHLDEERLYETFVKLIQRHEMLRTSFGVRGQEVVQYVFNAFDFKLLRYRAAEEQVAAIRDEFIKPFDLGSNSLLRVGLIEISATNHILMVDMHHIISDGVSMGIMIKEFMALYNHEALPDVALHYKDYAEQQHRDLQQEKIARQREFWMNEFADEISPLQLPADFARPVVKNFSGDHVRFELGREEYTRLKAVGEQEGATVFMTTLALFNTLLSKLGNTEDLVVGTPTAGRSQAGLENIIGIFVNTLSIRSYPKGEMTFREYLLDVKSRVLACFEHEMYPYEELIHDLHVKRDTSHNPLFDVMFSFQYFDSLELTIPGLTLSSYGEGQQTSKFDLSLVATEGAGNLFFTFEYSTELFTRATIERFVEYLKRIVTAIVSDPDVRLSAVEMLSGDEKNQLLVAFNDTRVAYPRDATIMDLVEAQVKQTPEAIALVYDGVSMTYKVMHERSNSLAQALIQQGVQPNDIVCIMAGQSLEMIIGVLGILKAGAVFLPIDPAYPKQRIEYVLEDSGAKLLLSQSDVVASSGYAGGFMDLQDPAVYNHSTEDIIRNNTAEDLAYVIYTSGSTGAPKGTLIKHRSLVNLCYWHNDTYQVTAADRSSKYAGFGFDASVWEIFPYLIMGASLHIIDDAIKLDFDALNNYYEANNITISFLPTQACEQFVRLQNNSLRVLLTGGDRLHAVAATRYTVVNNYGPTENTVVTTRFVVDGGYSIIPIGKPIHNTHVYILDKHQALVPIGVAGELYIGGDGLSAGYLHNPALTDEKFVRNPYAAGERIFKTGDLAKWLPNGNIEFIGRIDDQVKIRGFRIELGEIQHQLLAHAAIKEAVVLAKERSGESYLVAYYASEQVFEESEIRNYLSARIPEYMIPAYSVRVDQLPLTANGKVDRKSLPEPEVRLRAEDEAPATVIEAKLVEIWSEVLKLDPKQIGVRESFFDLGGHSLRATFAVNSIQRTFGRNIPLQLFFRMPTIKALAGLIQPAGDDVADMEVVDSREEYNF